ncbi:MAG: transcriptional regulator, CdaR [Firmicutes bacterium]|nr:transcriptional regulator, CdaR [Bacillota bacterium]
MIVKLRDILGLPGLSEMKVVAGATGLDRVLHWTHHVDLPDVVNWVQGGELLFTTGIGIRDHLEQLPQIVRECYMRNVAGLVINVGPYIEITPAEVVKVADDLGFPVIEIPWEIKLVEVTRVIYNFIAMQYIEEKSVQDILENILYGSLDNSDILVARSASCGYDLAAMHQIMVIKFKHLTSYLMGAGAVTEHQIHLVKLQMQSIIRDTFGRSDKKVLIMIRLDMAIVMIPVLSTDEEQHNMRTIVEAVLQEFQTQFAGLSLYIGWGKAYAGINEIRKSLSQAEQAMLVAQTLPENHKYTGFDELGFYKVLFNVKDRKELEDFRNEILNTLLEHDQRHGAELVTTLTIFLEENENFNRVSERMFIHRNTIKYRLQKIDELSGRSLVDPKERMLLYFATIVHKFLSL